ncbi:hypothetical protein [Dyadobacter sp. CY312]|uniref:hypothetical protein n=1 Tax=Dyadobacter sp. CY312 TaxID=2907303 RepID=UPI001F30085B|nr:hypothetical protein [Dyadobacter sp. CY312]MCE7039265.1 hypothetical protein [Dyadobacter sp. CY312]
MKINVTVDLDDFFSEDNETSFSEEIKNDISYRVKSELYGIFKKEMQDKFNTGIIEEIRAHKDVLFAETIAKMILENKIKKQYSTDEMIPVAQWINEELERSTLNDRNVNEILSKLVKSTVEQISAELKNRYDLLFASQIVTKLNANGFLKEDVAKILLSIPS